MNKTIANTCCALILPLVGGISCAQSEFDSWQEALAAGGLTTAETYLADQRDTAETAFLLGSVRFLQAFETVFRQRYANFSGQLPIVPGMAAELPSNPDAEFDPMFFEMALNDALNHLTEAERALESATDGEFGVVVNLGDFWFDINADGARDPWEGLTSIIGSMNPRRDFESFDGLIRFDTADADWLAAYVHAVAGVLDFALSLDPTPAIRTVYEGRTTIEQIAGIAQTPFIGDDDDALIDSIAAVLLTLEGVPDSTRTRAAHAHFKSMIAHNRSFWEKVGQETDDDREWLPNPGQTAAFGVPVDDTMALAWQDVLDEIDAILDGEQLIPYWRVRPRFNAESPIGLNLRRLLQDPPDMNIILWIQGAAAAPYLEEGSIADMNAWRQFLRMTPGNSFLQALWFN